MKLGKDEALKFSSGSVNRLRHHRQKKVMGIPSFRATEQILLKFAIITVKEEERGRCRHRFRQLSRDVCREIFDVPEDNRVLMAYERTQHTETHIGEISFQVADTKKDTPGVPFDDDYYHQITFLFVKQDFQGRGVGKALVERSIQIMGDSSRRPVRVQSAENAVGFFKKLGFELQGEVIESACGVRLFRFMYNMEFSFS